MYQVYLKATVKGPDNKWYEQAALVVAYADEFLDAEKIVETVEPLPSIVAGKEFLKSYYPGCLVSLQSRRAVRNP